MNFDRIRILFSSIQKVLLWRRETARQVTQNQFNNPNGLVQAHSHDRTSFKGYKLTLYMKC